MADQTILKEYLLALGFKVDSAGQKKMTNTVGTMDKMTSGLGKTILGVAAATQAMVGIWAVQMEKLYYSSKRIGTTVGNLQSLKFGASQIGIAGEHMQASLEGIARNIRSNPGLAGLIQSFGVKVQGRDMGDIAIDFVKALNKMPPYITERYGALFGIDADTLFMLREGVAEMEKAAGIRKKAASDLGIDSEKAAAAGKEYVQTWREIMMYVDLFKEALSVQLLPGMREFAKSAKEALISIIGWVQAGMPGAKTDIKSKEGKALGKSDPYSFSALMRGQFGVGAQAPAGATAPALPSPSPSAPASAGSGSGGSGELFARLEKKYGIPAGLLDKVWQRESGRGKYMLSPAGAKGHFGFMDPTAKAYGLQDPNNLEQSADASARMWSDLLKQYNGDMRRSAAAYNWGSGNMARQGLGAAPKETRDYMDAIGGPAGGVQQTVHITVTGAGNAQQTADAIAAAQRQVNADLVRQLKPRMY